jgi:hypothetical protein
MFGLFSDIIGMFYTSKTAGYWIPGEIMTPKKAWAVIIILLGILFFLAGFNTYYGGSFHGNEIRGMGEQISGAGYGQPLD